MKPTKFDHDAALEACWNFSDYRPDFDPQGSYFIDTPDCALAQALNCLDFTAGMYACNEKTHYSRSEFEAALHLVVTATEGHVRLARAAVSRAAVSYEKGPAQTPPTPNSRSHLRKMPAIERWARCAADPQFKALCESYNLTVCQP